MTDEAKAAAEAYAKAGLLKSNHAYDAQSFLDGIVWRDAHPSEAAKGLIDDLQKIINFYADGNVSARAVAIDLRAALAKYREEGE